MSKSYGRIKGRAFEREIFKDLKPLIPDIRLTMGSGSGSIEKADLYSDKLALVIECKRYKKLSVNLTNKFWTKLVNYAAKIDYESVLIFKNNNEPIMVITDNDDTLLLSKYSDWIKQFQKEENDLYGFVDLPNTYVIDVKNIWESTKDEDKFIDLYSNVVSHEQLHIEIFNILNDIMENAVRKLQDIRG